MNHLSDDLIELANKMGWNEEIVMLHLFAFIEQRGLVDECEGYLECCAAEEVADNEKLMMEVTS